MSKKSKIMTLDEWIEALNPPLDAEIIDYTSSIKKMEKKAFQELVYRNTFNRLCNILLVMFKWKLPETMSERAIETGLLWRGWLCAYRKPGYGDFCLPCSPTNVWTINGDPTQVSVYGYNGYQDFVNIKQPFETPTPTGTVIDLTNTKNEGVCMRDNRRAYPYINYIKQYAYQLSDKIIALNIATQRLKSPFEYVFSDKEMKDTFQQIVNKIESNEDHIFVVKSNNMGKSLQDIAQFIPNPMKPEVITHMKEAILFDFNQFLETIGVNTNPDPDKSQYVNNADIGSNNSLVDLSKDIRFLNREKFCEDVKKILGIEMSVEVNVDELQQEINMFKKEAMGNDKNSEGQSSFDK